MNDSDDTPSESTSSSSSTASTNTFGTGRCASLAPHGTDGTWGSIDHVSTLSQSPPQGHMPIKAEIEHGGSLRTSNQRCRGTPTSRVSTENAPTLRSEHPYAEPPPLPPRSRSGSVVPGERSACTKGGGKPATVPTYSSGSGAMKRAQTEAVQFDRSVATQASLSPQDFGLRRWKEYAIWRHGNNLRFSRSSHGREILLETAATLRAKEIEELEHELQETKGLADELHAALRVEQSEKSKLQSRVVLLERQVEDMESARRRWLRDSAVSRGRGSNLERRLAGNNTGYLRKFLFGTETRADNLSRRSPTASASSSISSFVTREPQPPGSTTCKPQSPRITARRFRPPTEDAEEGRGRSVGCREKDEEDISRRTREIAELEKSELRRRHDVEMTAKQSRIEKMSLEIKKLEAERDGLRRAAETQADLFTDGFAELRACVSEIKEEASRRKVTGVSARGTGIPSTTAAAEGFVVNSPLRSVGALEGHSCSAEVGDGIAKTRPATQESQDHQMRSLQKLLVETLSAEGPAVALPPAVMSSPGPAPELSGAPLLVQVLKPPTGIPPATYGKLTRHEHQDLPPLAPSLDSTSNDVLPGQPGSEETTSPPGGPSVEQTKNVGGAGAPSRDSPTSRDGKEVVGDWREEASLRASGDTREEEGPSAEKSVEGDLEKRAGLDSSQLRFPSVLPINGYTDEDTDGDRGIPKTSGGNLIQAVPDPKAVDRAVILSPGGEGLCGHHDRDRTTIDEERHPEGEKSEEENRGDLETPGGSSP